MLAKAIVVASCLGLSSASQRKCDHAVGLPMDKWTDIKFPSAYNRARKYGQKGLSPLSAGVSYDGSSVACGVQLDAGEFDYSVQCYDTKKQVWVSPQNLAKQSDEVLFGYEKRKSKVLGSKCGKCAVEPPARAHAWDLHLELKGFAMAGSDHVYLGKYRNEYGVWIGTKPLRRPERASPFERVQPMMWFQNTHAPLTEIEFPGLQSLKQIDLAKNGYIWALDSNGHVWIGGWIKRTRLEWKCSQTIFSGCHEVQEAQLVPYFFWQAEYWQGKVVQMSVAGASGQHKWLILEDHTIRKWDYEANAYIQVPGKLDQISAADDGGAAGITQNLPVWWVDGRWHQIEFQLPERYAGLSQDLVQVEIGATHIWIVTKHTILVRPRPPSWTTLYSSGIKYNLAPNAANKDFGYTAPEIKSKAVFNSMFQNSNGLVRRQCSNCAESHKLIYLRRHTDVSTWDAYQNLLGTWAPEVEPWCGDEKGGPPASPECYSQPAVSNYLYHDFAIYSTFEEAMNDCNAWTFIGEKEEHRGFPGNGGPVGPSQDQWTTLNLKDEHGTLLGQKYYKFSVMSGHQDWGYLEHVAEGLH